VAVSTGRVNERRVMAPAEKETFMAMGDYRRVDKPDEITGMESSPSHTGSRRTSPFMR
jgi:hypothetical protein